MGEESFARESRCAGHPGHVEVVLSFTYTRPASLWGRTCLGATLQLPGSRSQSMDTIGFKYRGKI